MPFKPSKYQQTIFDAIKNTNQSIVINALAGSGKTTTIVEALKLVPKVKDTLFLAFNKSIATELRNRVPSNVEVNTLHSFGSKQLYRTFTNIQFSENKVFFKACKLFSSWGVDNEPKGVYCYRISRLVDLMRLTLTVEQNAVEKLADKYGIVIFEEEVKHAIQLYKICYKQIDQIDFTDMVFQVAVRDIKLPKYDYVFVDEAQDLSKCHHTIIRKIIRPNTGRLIAVGDSNQAIYGFAGADYESFERIKKIMPNTITLPLNECYRCAKSIILEAQSIVPQIEWCENAKEGYLVRPEDDEKYTVNDIKAGDWVVCRNLKPLIYVFRKLISRNIKANIKGREIGENLINLIKRTKKSKVIEVTRMMEVSLIKLRGKLYRKGFAKPENHVRYIMLNEQIEIVKMFSLDITSAKLLIAKISKIFVDNPSEDVTLSTIHRSKGLEAERVFFLNEQLIPSTYASTPEELQQEQNLRYVAITRSKHDLIYINVTEMEMKILFQLSKS